MKRVFFLLMKASLDTIAYVLIPYITASANISWLINENVAHFLTVMRNPKTQLSSASICYAGRYEMTILGWGLLCVT